MYYDVVKFEKDRKSRYASEPANVREKLRKKNQLVSIIHGDMHCAYILNYFLITDNDNDCAQKGSPLL